MSSIAVEADWAHFRHSLHLRPSKTQHKMRKPWLCSCSSLQSSSKCGLMRMLCFQSDACIFKVLPYRCYENLGKSEISEERTKIFITKQHKSRTVSVLYMTGKCYWERKQERWTSELFGRYTIAKLRIRLWQIEQARSCETTKDLR